MIRVFGGRAKFKSRRKLSTLSCTWTNWSCRVLSVIFFFFSSRRRHTRFDCDWSSDVCSSDLRTAAAARLVALTEVELLGEALLDHVGDRRVERVQPPELLALELGKRRINP